MRRPLLALGIALAAIASSAHAAPPAPQVTDTAGDANFVNGQGSVKGQPSPATAPASLGYADGLSVLWQTTWATRKVGRKTVKVADGFTVTTTLSAAPTPPSGTTLVYRMLGTPPCGDYFGVVYYTAASPSDPNIPQSAVRDNCHGGDTARLTKIAAPVIKDATMTWTVKFKELPKEIKPTFTFTNLWFEIREIENFPACLPDDGGLTPYGGACGLGVGQIDEGVSTASYTFGK